MLFSATDIVQWAATRDAQSRLPELVMRLVLATDPHVRQIEMRSGDGVHMPGFDGTVVSEQATAFVPEGRSTWELGVNASPGAKAEKDYVARSTATDPLQASTTYVAVLARRWTDKTKWADGHRDAGKWADVRALDADDLYNWLTQAPSVAAWFAAQIGKPTDGLRTLEGFWDGWTQTTDPPLDARLIVDARPLDPDVVVQALTGGSSATVVRAETLVDALGYIAGSVTKLEAEQRAAVLARSLVVDDRAGWRSAISSETPLLLLPTLDVDVREAIQRGHTVIVPRGPELAPSDASVDVPSLHLSGAHDALKEMGFESDRAWRLAGIARRSFPALRRTLARDPQVRDPAWASGDDARAVLVAALLGAWVDEREADRAIVEALCGYSYDQFRTTLTRLAHVPDAPVRRTAGVWLIADKDDAWQLVRRWVDAEDLDRLVAAAVEVLGEHDPALELPRDDRWMASVHDKVRRYSDHLRHGIADTIAMLGAVPGEPSHAVRAQAIVRDVLGRANDDNEGMLWVSLSELLPQLAEAAPDEFLTAVEQALVGDGPTLGAIFQDGGSGSALTVSAPHSGLCWALELLAWPREHVARSVLALLRLAQIDPGGRYSNRPDRSLAMILRPSYPQTRASSDERIGILRRAARGPLARETLALMRELLPSPGSTTIHPCRAPERRDWKVDDPRATFADIRATSDQLITALLEAAPEDVETIKLLASRVTFMTPRSSDAVLTHLTSAPLTDELRAAAADELRSLRRRTGRRRPEDAVPTKLLDRIDETIVELTPDDVVLRNAWLFGQRPDFDLYDVDDDGEFHRDWQRHAEALAERRSEAVGEILREEGVDGLRRLGPRSQHSWNVGIALADQPADDDVRAWVVECLAADDPGLQQIARGWVGRCFGREGWTWLADFVAPLPVSVAAQALYAVPISEQLLQHLDRDADLSTAYWDQLPSSHHALDSGLLESVAERLMEAGRFYASIDLIDLNTTHTDATAPSGLIARALEGIVEEDAERCADPAALPRHVASLLDALEADEGFDRSRLAMIEWSLVSITDKAYPPRVPRLLHHEMATSPAFFVQLVRLVVPSTDDDAPTDELVGENASTLLRLWRTLPGGDDEAIDGDKLAEWLDAVIDALAGDDRRTKWALHIVGEAFAHGPSGTDGHWPHEAIRDTIERIHDRALEDGFRYEITNSRGITSRAVFAGGEQERDLAATWEERANALAVSHPRTARLLADVASSYRSEGAMHDEHADVRQDLPWA